MIQTGIPYFHPFQAEVASAHCCVLSGLPVPEGPEGRLPLLPAFWIEQFSLADSKLQFNGGDSLCYTDILIPVHPELQAHIKSIQNGIPDLLTAGWDGLNWIQAERLYQWMCWLGVGLLYQEFVRPLDRRPTSMNFLKDPGMVHRFSLIHLSLCAVLRKVHYENFDPGSLFIFQSHTYANPRLNFNLKVSLNTLCLSVRAGEVTVMACLQDNGTQIAFFESYFRRFDGITLHPIQLDELFARLSYKAYLMNPRFHYGLAWPEEAEKDATTFVRLEIPEEDRERDAFRPWNEQVYGSVLLAQLSPYGMSQVDLQGPNQEIVTFLEEADGRIYEVDAHFNPITDQQKA